MHKRGSFYDLVTVSDCQIVDEDFRTILKATLDYFCLLYTSAIADFYKIDSSKVFVGVGSDDVLAVIFMTFFNSKKPILFPDITYRCV